MRIQNIEQCYSAASIPSPSHKIVFTAGIEQKVTVFVWSCLVSPSPTPFPEYNTKKKKEDNPRVCKFIYTNFAPNISLLSFIYCISFTQSQSVLTW